MTNADVDPEEYAAALDATVHALSVIKRAGALKRDQLRVDPDRDPEEAVDHVLIGSVAERVVRTSSAPVLTVRPEA